MTPIIEGLLFCWNKNTAYAPKLIADLSAEQMLLQPAPSDMAPSNHPAWVLSHLNVYLPVIEHLIRGEAFEDPRNHQFGMLSSPESDPNVYAPKEELLESFMAGHRSVADLLSQESDAVFEQAVQLPRWAAVMPTVGSALPYLMLNHENQHLGQVSAWRRIQGLPSV
ncbi:MAG: DinB family protein [Mariniblastus sp.]|nr:DinB family protein [Mariniblastus sp.]